MAAPPWAVYASYMHGANTSRSETEIGRGKTPYSHANLLSSDRLILLIWTSGSSNQGQRFLRLQAIRCTLFSLSCLPLDVLFPASLKRRAA